MSVLVCLLLVPTAAAEASLMMIPEIGPEVLFPPIGSPLPSNARLVVMRDEIEVSDVSAGQRTPVEQIAGAGPLTSLTFLDLDPAGRGTVDLIAACQGCADDVFLSWLVAPDIDVDPPEYSAAAPLFWVGVDSNSPRQWGVSVCLPTLVADEPAIHILQADVDYVAQQRSPGSCLMGESEQVEPGTFFYVVAPFSPFQPELCVRAEVVDGAGNIGSLPEVCIPLQSEQQFTGGCSQTGATAPLALVGLLLKRRFRRRSAVELVSRKVACC